MFQIQERPHIHMLERCCRETVCKSVFAPFPKSLQQEWEKCWVSTLRVFLTGSLFDIKDQRHPYHTIDDDGFSFDWLFTQREQQRRTKRPIWLLILAIRALYQVWYTLCWWVSISMQTIVAFFVIGKALKKTHLWRYHKAEITSEKA